ncbi:BQ2448_1080 [Microbotryum intermedium]|uniref:BQ2448_1080 protein n=1 Tax=Microbotryum intermedium TaxID=269621 RepID=A0A238FF31_9BASI|nr:BQ2448_1080 [Microbotryum intermedium]
MSNGATPGVWRRGGVVGSNPGNPLNATRDPPSHGRGRGGPSSRARGVGVGRGGFPSSNQSISSHGLSTARASIGRKVDPMELLQSPSRGLNGQVEGVDSLQDPSTQEKFYEWIRAKISKFDTTWNSPISATERPRPHLSPKAQQELGIILLDLRKLREGLTCLRRDDPFALKGRSGSVRIKFWGSWLKLLTALASFLSVRNLSPCLASRIELVRRRDVYYTSLHLLFILSSTKTSPTNLSLASQSVSDGTTAPDHLAFWETWQSLDPSVQHSPSIKSVRFLSGLLLRGDYVRFGKLVSSSRRTSSNLSSKSPVALWDPLQLLLVERFIPFVRTKAWERVSKSYKLKSDLEDWEWLSKVLLFELDGEGGEVGKERCRKWVEEYARVRG